MVTRKRSPMYLLSAALLAGALMACTTPGPDTTPEAFNITAVTNADAGVTVNSGEVTVAGIDADTPISITGGKYSINGAAFTSANGTVKNGDKVKVQVTSSANSQGVAKATLTIGGVSSEFSVTTKLINVATNNPALTDFTAVNDAVPSSSVTSNAVTVSGLADAVTTAAATVSAGVQMLIGTSTTPVTTANVKNGDTIKLVLTSANTFGAASPAATLTLTKDTKTATKTFNVKTGVLGTSFDATLGAPIPAGGSAVSDTTPTCAGTTGPGNDPIPSYGGGATKIGGIWVIPGTPTNTPLTATQIDALPKYDTLFGATYVYNPTNPQAGTVSPYGATWQICPPAGQFQPGVTNVTFTVPATNTAKTGKLVLETVLDHFYRGDIKITLTSPDGKNVVVFDLPNKGVASPNTGIAVKMDDDATTFSNATSSNKTVNIDDRCGQFPPDFLPDGVTPNPERSALTDKGNCWDNGAGNFGGAGNVAAIVNSKGKTLTTLIGSPVAGTWTMKVEDLFPGNNEQNDNLWAVGDTTGGKGPKQVRAAKLLRAKLSIQPITAAP